jgi:hypothetical protein
MWAGHKDENGYGHTNCHEEKFAWSDHVHDAVRVLEHFDHHFLFCLGWRLMKEVSDSVTQSASEWTCLALRMCTGVYLEHHE